MNTQENNQLIAEFMGARVIKGLFSSKEALETSDMNCYISLPKHITVEALKFHTSWDWLMPVVDKIEREHKANFRIKCTWNEFTGHSIHQVIVNIEQGEMSKDKSCIYDSKKIYDYVGDAVKDKREATYKAVVEFIKQYNNQ